MASIKRDEESGIFRIHFRFGKKRFHKSLETDNETDAEGMKGQIELLLLNIERGVIPVPPTADLWEFLYSNRTREQKVVAADVMTLEGFFTRYEELMPEGKHEQNTLGTYRLHKAHLLSILGKKTSAGDVNTTRMQEYINRRGKEQYRGKRIGSKTIKKEVATFRAVWNVLVEHGVVSGLSPTRKLAYPKRGEEKLPFMTWEQIEQRIARNGLTDEQLKACWDCLFLDTVRVVELLAHVKDHANPAFPFIYPMFVFVAHTGARRSEMMRCLVDDLDFEERKVRLREKKRDRERSITFREVPMTRLLADVLLDWLRTGHPGGPFTFSTNQTELTRKQADSHFENPLKGSKWTVVKGHHVLRHSFASNLADRGVRENVIDKWMGHQTEDMRKRYRHLFPREDEETLNNIFGC